MRRTKVLSLVMAVGMLCTMSVTGAMAADVSALTPDTTMQQKITLEKTEEVTPIYTVEIPATVELSKEAKDLSFTLNLTPPTGKYVSVKIASAGYPTALDRFAVWNKRILEEASYEVYYSDRMEGGRYSIGDEIVSWGAGNSGTQNRRIKLLNYESIKPGTYSGVINYTISLADAT